MELNGGEESRMELNGDVGNRMELILITELEIGRSSGGF